MFYGHYKSSDSGTTGCLKEFMTVGREKMLFPPMVSYECDLCKRKHGFRFVGGQTVSTPSQVKQFDAYCTQRSIERDVNIG